MKIHKLKAGEKATRITALVLTAALIFTSIDLAVFAAANEGIKTQEVITGFGELDESVAVQLLPVGAQESEIVFPDTLTVMLETNSVEESTGDVTQETDAADVLHWRKSIAMHMTMIRIPSAMTVALNGR